jgi:hypothetical protein
LLKSELYVSFFSLLSTFVESSYSSEINIDKKFFHFYAYFQQLLKGLKKMKNEQLIQVAIKSVMDCLSDISFIKIIKRDDVPLNDLKTDCIFHIETPLGGKKIYAEIKDNGQPRYAGVLIDKISMLKEDSKKYWIFVAPYISEKTGKMLRDSGIGFIDFAGNSYISFEGVHIQKEGKKNPFLKKRHFNSLFRLKASRILRVLLSNPNQYWKIEQLAKKAQVSNGHVYNIKEELLDREWAIVDNKGLKLNKPKSLLEEWCKEYQKEKKPYFSFYSLLAPSEFEARTVKVCNDLNVRYALSGLSGAFQVAPFARYHRVSFYLEDKLNEFVKTMDLKSVTSGENVTIMIPLDDGVFYDVSRIEEMSVVSPIQLYLDLSVLGDRGKETADYIFKEVIEPQWKKKK